MSNFTEKMRLFCEARAQNVKPRQAAMLAGYSEASAQVQASKLQAREDVRALIAKMKKGGDKEPSPFKVNLKDKYDSPLDFMLDCMNNPKLMPTLRFEAAKQALPYVNPRVEAKGKKDARKDAAHDVTKRTKFAPKKRPPLPENVTPFNRQKRA